MTRYPEVIEKVIRRERIPLAERLRLERTLPVQGDIPRGITAKDIVVGACVLGGVILVGYLLYRGITAKSVSPPIPKTKSILDVEVKQPPKEPVSPEERAKAKAYRQTEKYKASQKKYRQSEKGKAAAKRAREKRKAGLITLKAESLKATVESDKKVKLETKKKGKVKKKAKKPDKKVDKTVTTPAKAPKEEATKTALIPTKAPKVKDLSVKEFKTIIYDDKTKGTKGHKKYKIALGKALKENPDASTEQVLEKLQELYPNMIVGEFYKDQKTSKTKKTSSRKGKPTGKPMNKKMQIIIIKKELKKRGIEPDTVDVDAEVDSKLTLTENKRNILAKVGKAKAGKPESKRTAEGEKLAEDAIADVEERIARGENGHLRGFAEGFKYHKEVTA